MHSLAYHKLGGIGRTHYQPPVAAIDVGRAPTHIGESCPAVSDQAAIEFGSCR